MKDKKKDKDKVPRNGAEKKNKEDGEWSEDELERKRRLLLEQLAEEQQWILNWVDYVICVNLCPNYFLRNKTFMNDKTCNL